MKRNWSPEERRRFREQAAEWARQRREFEEIVERWQVRMRARRERRERRLDLVRRLLPRRP
jgi:hypothetical protein